MDTGKFVGLLVFFLVGALVLVAFVPIIQETTSATDTFENKGYYYMEKLTTDSPEYTVTWDYTEPNKIVVNDIETELPTSTTFPASIVASDTWGIRYTIGGGDVGLSIFGAQNGIIGSASTNENTSMEMLFSNGSAEITVNDGVTDTTYTMTYEQVYVVSSENKEYAIMKYGDGSVYVKDDSVIYGTGRTLVSGTQYNININGTIEDGFDVAVIWPTGFTAGDVTINATAVNGYIDLYSFESIEYPISDGNTTVDVTYSQVIVPATVVAEKTIHADTTLATVINLLPLIAGVGLLMFLVAEFLYTRYL